MMAAGAPVPHTRGYDLLFASPVAIFYGFVVAGNVILIANQLGADRGWLGGLEIAQEIATLAFFGMQAGLLLVRRLPQAKSEGLLPRAIAIIGANSNFALLLLPRVTLHDGWAILSFAFTIAGTVAAAAILAWLGRSFSIMPEARALVVNGPYRVIRHPLYLAEIVATFGIMLRFGQPWSLLITLTTLFFQVRRMDAEEAVLSQAYPDYGPYAGRTARLVPGVY